MSHDAFVGTNNTERAGPDREAQLKALREERDALVAAVSWLDEPDLLCDVLRTLRVLEGEISGLEE